jgi:hypothetical protein
MAKPNSSLGHWYRAVFSALAWMVVIAALFMAPASFVRNRLSFLILISGLLLTISFSILTVVLWLVDRNRAK